jgi:predicted PurR-regulated permease PerM
MAKNNTDIKIVNSRQSKIIQRRDLPLTILAWIGVTAVIFFILQKIWSAIVIFIFASVIAYLFFPAMKFLEKFIPRLLAIFILYTILLLGFGVFLFFFLRIAILQTIALIPVIQKIFIPSSPKQVTPIYEFFRIFGISRNVLTTVGTDLAQYIEPFATDIVPIIGNFFSSIFSIFIVIVISIYLLLDGERIAQWLGNKHNIPLSQRGKTQFLINTLHHVVGSYIRGQLLLSIIIGVLVGLGMALFQVPYALLLGILAFFMEFVPILGIFISGGACMLLALTHGWLIAVLVLAYFIGIHIVEADILGPRIVGKALGIHPLVSLLAIFAASEVFGVYGILFAAPAIGLLQAICTAIWHNWKRHHPQEFR